MSWTPRLAGPTLLACLLGACAAHPAQPAPAAAAALDLAAQELAQARAMVAAFESGQPSAAVPPELRAPASLDDVELILKRDQINLFGAGAALACAQSDARALALCGQIELAWGEALSLVAELQSQAYAELSRQARGLELALASGAPAGAGPQELVALRDEAARAVTLAAALDLVASEHIAAGAEVARTVIERFPESYLGYRVAADYYRLRRQWDRFDTMVAALRATNPDSNGLRFVQGVAAWERGRDRAAAAAQFEAALAADPDFVRAQAHLLLIQPTVADTARQLRRLAERNGEHQIVVLAGPAIERAALAAPALP